MLTPAQAIRRLRLELHHLAPEQPGRPRVYEGHGPAVSVLSIDDDLTVWCYHGLLCWYVDGRRVRHLADDPGGAAWRIAHTWSHHGRRRHPYGGMSGPSGAAVDP